MASPTPLDPPVTMQRSVLPLRLFAVASPQSQFSPCATRPAAPPRGRSGGRAASLGPCAPAAKPACPPEAQAQATLGSRATASSGRANTIVPVVEPQFVTEQ